MFHVNLTVIMRNLLSSVLTQVLNKLIEACDWPPFRKRTRVWFVHGHEQNGKQKHRTKKLVEFHNYRYAVTMF